MKDKNSESRIRESIIKSLGSELAADIWLNKYTARDQDGNLVDDTIKDSVIRMTNAIMEVERRYPNPMKYEEVEELLDNFSTFILGGSVIFGLNNPHSYSTLGSCFVIESPYDSYSGIMKADEELVQLMKRRGGVGIDLTTLRPRKSVVRNAARTSSGVASFMERFSNSTREVAQEGRRGALMLTIDVTHKDARYFVTAKDDITKITGANISVRMNEKFMEGVLGGTLSREQKALWDTIINQMWKNGEPGLLFWDTIIRESPADCYPGFKTISTNPCSELPLCAYDSCRLGSINIYAFVRNPYTRDAYMDYKAFAEAVRRCQRVMDDIVDIEMMYVDKIRNKILSDPEPEELKRRELSLWNNIYDKLTKGRRTGLGLMGLADAGAALGLRYGSKEFTEFAVSVARTLAVESYSESIIMAEERGCFEVFSHDLERDHPFINRILSSLPKKMVDKYRRFGRRNIANLTIPPTGSISILAGVTSGIEPLYAPFYKRSRKVTEESPNKTYRDKTGDWWEEYYVIHPGILRWMKYNNIDVDINSISQQELSDLVKRSPYHMSTTYEIDPFAKVAMQGMIQEWIDHGISVTHNMLTSATRSDIEELAIFAYSCGCKGFTIYRDGSRDNVISLVEPNKSNAPSKRPAELPCDIYNTTVRGQLWKVLIGLKDYKPYEIFAFNSDNTKINISKGIIKKVASGKYDLLTVNKELCIEDITSRMSSTEEALTRILSWGLRNNADLKFVVEQLNKAKDDVTSFSKALARTLKRYIANNVVSSNRCDVCGANLVYIDGCEMCMSCGNSKCS